MSGGIDSVGQRENALDALRGYAALAVVIAHTMIVGVYGVGSWEVLKWMPLRIFWSGHQAVILFFTLSGFALARMLVSMKGHSYGPYVAARFVRLFPPYIAALALAFALYWLLGVVGITWERDWVAVAKPMWDNDLALQHVLMIGIFDTSAVNPPIWSIVHEMRLSIVFPILFMIVARYGGRVVMSFACLSLSFAAVCWSAVPVWMSSSLLNILSTVHYGTFFVAGAWVAIGSEPIRAWGSALSRRCRIMFWVVALLLYAYPFENAWTIGQRAAGDVAIGIGSALMIALSLTIPGHASPPLGRWLGKISYSLYLNHLVVMNLAIILLYEQHGAFVVWCVVIAGSLLLAAIMQRLFEAPSHEAARALRRYWMRKQEPLAAPARN